MKRSTILAALAGLLCLSGCGTLDETYVRADRATFDSLAPWVRAKADPIADDAKLLVLDSWEARLEEIEKDL